MFMTHGRNLGFTGSKHIRCWGGIVDNERSQNVGLNMLCLKKARVDVTVL